MLDRHFTVHFCKLCLQLQHLLLNEQGFQRFESLGIEWQHGIGFLELFEIFLYHLDHVVDLYLCEKSDVIIEVEVCFVLENADAKGSIGPVD